MCLKRGDFGGVASQSWTLVGAETCSRRAQFVFSWMAGTGCQLPKTGNAWSGAVLRRILDSNTRNQRLTFNRYTHWSLRDPGRADSPPTNVSPWRMSTVSMMTTQDPQTPLHLEFACPILRRWVSAIGLSHGILWAICIQLSKPVLPYQAVEYSHMCTALWPCAVAVLEILHD